MQTLTQNSRFSVNWLGVWTLYVKEVKRFLKVYNQTLFAPMINAMLLLAIFSLALGERVQTINGVPFQVFMVPGLMMMSMIQNAFANTSSAFIMGKVVGTLIDYLIPPITAGEMTFCMVMAGVSRGIVVGLAVAIPASFFVPLEIFHFGWLVFYTISACLMMALVGMISGIFADSFDQMAAINSYIIVPLSFLSGTFYSIKQLPEFWQLVSYANPFFYMIDGFRYSMTGYNDGSLLVGAIFITLCNVALWITTHILLARGVRIKT